MDSIEIDEVNRANYRNQAENIELDEQATEIQKPVLIFMQNFMMEIIEGELNSTM